MMRAARRTFSEMKPRTRFVIKTFNKISPQGLERFRPEMYRIKPGEDQQFPEHTQEELRSAFSTECLWPGAPPIEELSPMEPHPDDTRIVLDRIVLRVRYDGPSGPGEKHLLLMMPSGC